jgi:transcriptional regulator with GAF, ATPase, and Fis domain
MAAEVNILEVLVSLATTTIAGADAASVSVARAGRAETLTATSESCRTVDEMQHQTGQGPCVAAIGDGRHHQVTLATDDTQWPDFSRAATAVGVRAVLATPLRAGGRTLGALNLYSMSDAVFGPVDVERAQEFADCMAAVLAITDAFAAATEQNGQMLEALVTRSMIGQAQGLLMGRHGITADGAFDWLRTRSQHTNRKLREVAQEVVDDAESGARRPAAG